MPIADAFLPGTGTGKVLSANSSAQLIAMPAGTTLEIQNASASETVFVEQEPVTNAPTANTSISYAVRPGQVKVIRKQDGATVLGYIASGNATAYIYGGDGGIGVGGSGGTGNVTVSGGNLTANQSVNLNQVGSAPITLTRSSLPGVGPSDYEFVAASASNQTLGATGATGDVFDLALIVPATVSPAAVQVSDGGTAKKTLFEGGANSVLSLTPFTVPGPGKSVTGNWALSTGANVSVMTRGLFT